MSTIDTSEPKPRVNFAQLQQYVGRRVLLVGTVEQAGPGTVQIRTSDNGTVTVTPAAPPAYNTECVEFDVNVTGPNTVQEIGHTCLSAGFGASQQHAAAT